MKVLGLWKPTLGITGGLQQPATSELLLCARRLAKLHSTHFLSLGATALCQKRWAAQSVGKLCEKGSRRRVPRRLGWPCDLLVEARSLLPTDAFLLLWKLRHLIGSSLTVSGSPCVGIRSVFVGAALGTLCDSATGWLSRLLHVLSCWVFPTVCCLDTLSDVIPTLSGLL